ncbi:multicopper oxidase domain-containing protein [Nocardioides mesophilus]|uniref:Multicopper oxidase domain-containing protein n=1 Tax=Nocardioides mesophilus TaxID=433659 RepID=A0A7G9R7K2_9ACTN|nr:multicopper oxidase domain-containing protein [Nocardioides mesophilus]QNN51577.1 multicopper oxidase domain-containing protein [Nocardioides mesophilus]
MSTLTASLKARLGGRRAAALLAVATMGVTTAALTPQTTASAADVPKVGIVCTPSDGGVAGKPIFNLTTRTGYISLPDGNTAFMWGYSHGFDAFQHPGPVLCVEAGDEVTVILHNTLPDPTSIVFPGQEGVLADGIASTPVRSSGKVTSLSTTAAASTGTVTYSFTAANPGTYLYESGTNPEKQVRMGLFGALIVRPAGQPHQAYDSANSDFTPDREFMVLLSEIDPYQHQRVEQGQSFNIDNYHPRYWLINGRGFPDSIADNGASWLPSQPYGALAEIMPNEPSLARYLNVGTEDYPFHPHGNNGLVIGRDGHPLTGPTGEDLSMEKFDINIGPGQTWDVRFSWHDAEDYSAANPVPVTTPNLANSFIGTFYSGSPYLGRQETLPTGTPTLNQCGEYYIISHNHALFQITSWGANMTGPITYMRIDPPGHYDCK